MIIPVSVALPPQAQAADGHSSPYMLAAGNTGRYRSAVQRAGGFAIQHRAERTKTPLLAERAHAYDRGGVCPEAVSTLDARVQRYGYADGVLVHAHWSARQVTCAMHVAFTRPSQWLIYVANSPLPWTVAEVNPTRGGGVPGSRHV